MRKEMKFALIAALVVGAGYLAWRWWQNRSSGQIGSGGVPQLGTNLNSKAPELIGTTAAGPTAGPAVDLPVNITLTETYNSAEGVSARTHGFPPIDTQHFESTPMQKSNNATPNPLMSGQDDSGVQPQGGATGVATGTDDTGDTTDVSNGS